MPRSGLQKKEYNLTAKALAGDPGYDIARFANNAKNGIDLIVIGARGRGSAKEIVLGKCFKLRIA